MKKGTAGSPRLGISIHPRDGRHPLGVLVVVVVVVFCGLMNADSIVGGRPESMSTAPHRSLETPANRHDAAPAAQVDDAIRGHQDDGASRELAPYI